MRKLFEQPIYQVGRERCSEMIKSLDLGPAQRACRPWVSHLLQQNLDEAFLLCAVPWEFLTFASELAELTICPETLHFVVWVSTMIHEVEKVDEDRSQSLTTVSGAHAGRVIQGTARKTLYIPSGTE